MELKKAGRRNISCEECGWVFLDRDAEFVWDLFQRHTNLLIAQTGMGGWYVNAPGLELLAREKKIEDILLFDELVELCAGILFRHEEEEKTKTGVDIEKAIEESP